MSNDWQAPGAPSQPGRAVPPEQHGQVPAPQYGQLPPPQFGQVPAPAYGPGPQPSGVPPQAGWAPPPKPGLVALRPLTLGDILGASFRVFRRNPRTTFGTSVVFTLVSMIVTAGIGALIVAAAFGRVSSALPQDQDAILPGTVAGAGVALLVPLFFQVAVQAILQGVLVLETSHQVVGERMRLGGLLRQARGRIWALIGWSVAVSGALIVAIGVVAGLVALLVVGVGQAAGIASGVILGVVGGAGLVVLAVWIGTKTVLVPSILMLERLSFRAAIARSWRLTRGSFWRTLGTLLLVSIIVSVATQIATIPIGLIGGIGSSLLTPNGTTGTDPLDPSFFVIQGATYFVTLVISAIGAVIQTATIALVYVDLRIRREGLDLELVRYVELRAQGVRPLPDPYAPPPADAAPYRGPWGGPPAPGGYGQPAYGQPGFGQPAYGQRGFGPPGFGPPPPGGSAPQQPGPFGPPGPQ